MQRDELNKMRHIYYFDSLGLGPFLFEHVQFINNITSGGDEVIFNKRPLQHESSDVCGQYVVQFVIHMSRGGAYDDFIKQFGSDLMANDVKIKRALPNEYDLKGGGQISKAVTRS